MKQELLNVRTANACMEDAKLIPIPKKLAGDFWYSGEFAILFADTNVGKSPLAVQIADTVSGGSYHSFLICEEDPQQVALIDFELSEKQFQSRYSRDYQREYRFSNRLHRVTVNTDYTDFDQFEKELFESIEQIIYNRNIKVLIVDNISYLKALPTETSKEAMPLMRYLNQMKLRYGLSILVLAHTPKRLHLTNPLGLNDLAGSKNLSNFADSVFCIGRSTQANDIRYLKHLKCRSNAIIYDTDNVLVCRIDKPDNFLGFEFVGYESEKIHLQEKTALSEDIKNQVVEMKLNDPTLSLGKIAEHFPGMYRAQVSRILKKAGITPSE